MKMSSHLSSILMESSLSPAGCCEISVWSWAGDYNDITYPFIFSLCIENSFITSLEHSQPANSKYQTFLLTMMIVFSGGGGVTLNGSDDMPGGSQLIWRGGRQEHDRQRAMPQDAPCSQVSKVNTQKLSRLIWVWTSSKFCYSLT